MCLNHQGRLTTKSTRRNLLDADWHWPESKQKNVQSYFSHYLCAWWFWSAI